MAGDDVHWRGGCQLVLQSPEVMAVGGKIVEKLLCDL